MAEKGMVKPRREEKEVVSMTQGPPRTPPRLEKGVCPTPGTPFPKNDGFLFPHGPSIPLPATSRSGKHPAGIIAYNAPWVA